LRNLSFRVISSSIFSVPSFCGEILKDIIPCTQNEQQTLPVMKTTWYEVGLGPILDYVKNWGVI